MGEPKTVHRYTVQEYLAMEEVAEYRSEYFEGEIFAMSGGSLDHDRITGELHRLIANALSTGPCEPLTGNMKIRIEGSSAYYYPDLAIVCGEPQMEDKKKHIVTNPTVLFEVLSESTESFDRGKKFHRYKQISTLVEYILIAQSEPQIDAFYKVDDDTWMHRSYAGLKDVLELKSLGIQVKLADIYRRVQFA
jgi:Uma2 family endonuclease